MSPLTDCHACLLWLQSTNGTAMLTSGGKRVSWDVAADATTNNNPPITSTFGFYVTLTAELADDISLRHIILFFNFIKFTNPNPNPMGDMSGPTSTLTLTGTCQTLTLTLISSPPRDPAPPVFHQTN